MQLRATHAAVRARPTDVSRFVQAPQRARWALPAEASRGLRDAVAALSGHGEIAPGERLEDRHAPWNRDLARQFLAGRFKALGLDPQVQQYRDTGANIYATLPSTNGSRETVVVGAHFDSVRGGPGANDNATGSAMVLEAARHLAAIEDRSVNVVFVLFDEEEKGLIGSRHFAKMLHEQGTHVGSVHTVDQMGWDADGDRAIELELPDGNLTQLYTEVARETGLDIPIHVTHTHTSDHSSFRRYGFPSVGITEEYVNGDTTPYYHTPRDTFETVNWDYLASTSTLFDKVLERLVTSATRANPPPAERERQGARSS